MGKEGGLHVSAPSAKRLQVRHSNGTKKHQQIVDLQQRLNRLKIRRFLSPTKLCAPPAPRNTSSFIMYGKKAKGLPSLVSPVSPPYALSMPLSLRATSKEGLDEEVDKEWGVDSYGSMSGLIQLPSVDDGEREGYGDAGGSECQLDHLQCSHAATVQQLEQRIDQRFEIAFPSCRRLGMTLPTAFLDDEILVY